MAEWPFKNLVDEAEASHGAAEMFGPSAESSVSSSAACLAAAEQLPPLQASPAEQVAVLNCSNKANSYPGWNPESNQAICACVEGFEPSVDGSACVRIQTNTTGPGTSAQVDCSGYGNAEPYWDASRGQTLCGCMTGYEWNNNRPYCRVHRDVQVSLANCSAYPNTYPAWNNATEQVECVPIQTTQTPDPSGGSRQRDAANCNRIIQDILNARFLNDQAAYQSTMSYARQMGCQVPPEVATGPISGGPRTNPGYNPANAGPSQGPDVSGAGIPSSPIPRTRDPGCARASTSPLGQGDLVDNCF